ncbi:hypothetical protein [Subtercola endophyticus]|uniref:hypothetical protein n=1 Tax=Subtercola endophyticus TaxID=2895559 RepID=UPI001E3A037E|nr:hypothetical protein [Subtercola endophyticus]UFS57843.1 hypothetical protein LQ955_12425 [Subtercola endophyticus]
MKFTSTGTLNQSNSISQLVATWAALPGTDTQGAPSGTIILGTAYGVLSDGTTTPVIACNADFW